MRNQARERMNDYDNVYLNVVWGRVHQFVCYLLDIKNNIPRQD